MINKRNNKHKFEDGGPWYPWSPYVLGVVNPEGYLDYRQNSSIPIDISELLPKEGLSTWNNYYALQPSYEPLLPDYELLIKNANKPKSSFNVAGAIGAAETAGGFALDLVNAAKGEDYSQQLSDIQNSVLYTDNPLDLMNSPTKGHYNADLPGSMGYIKNIGTKAASGAIAGSAFGPWGTAIGAVVGGLAGAGLTLLLSNAEKEKAKNLNEAYDVAYNQNLASRNQGINNYNKKMTNSLLQNMAAFGGPIFNPDFSNNIIDVTEGGTHELNPYGGVPVGVNPDDGLPNLVEEGEEIYNDYVFSNRLEVPAEERKRLRLRGNTYAECFRNALKESEERPNDKASMNYLNRIFVELMLSQEMQRSILELLLYTLGGYLFGKGGPTDPPVLDKTYVAQGIEPGLQRKAEDMFWEELYSSIEKNGYYVDPHTRSEWDGTGDVYTINQETGDLEVSRRPIQVKWDENGRKVGDLDYTQGGIAPAPGRIPLAKIVKGAKDAKRAYQTVQTARRVGLGVKTYKATKTAKETESAVKAVALAELNMKNAFKAGKGALETGKTWARNVELTLAASRIPLSLQYTANLPTPLTYPDITTINGITSAVDNGLKSAAVNAGLGLGAASAIGIPTGIAISNNNSSSTNSGITGSYEDGKYVTKKLKLKAQREANALLLIEAARLYLLAAQQESELYYSDLTLKRRRSQNLSDLLLKAKRLWKEDNYNENMGINPIFAPYFISRGYNGVLNNIYNVVPGGPDKYPYNNFTYALEDNGLTDREIVELYYPDLLKYYDIVVDQLPNSLSQQYSSHAGLLGVPLYTPSITPSYTPAASSTPQTTSTTPAATNTPIATATNNNQLYLGIPFVPENTRQSYTPTGTTRPATTSPTLRAYSGLSSSRNTYSFEPIEGFRYWDATNNNYDAGYRDFVLNILTDDLIKQLELDGYLSENTLSRYLGAGLKKENITADYLRGSRGALDKKYSDLHQYAATLYDAYLNQLRALADKQEEALEEPVVEEEPTLEDSKLSTILGGNLLPERFIEDPKDNWMRYMGMVGPMAGLILNATSKKPEMTPHVNPYLIGYNPIGNYVKYTPMDITYAANLLANLNNGLYANIMNLSGPSRNSALIAAQNNALSSYGDLYRKSVEADNARRIAAEEFNRGTNILNANNMLQTATHNLNAINSAKQINANIDARNNALMHQYYQDIDNGIGANLSNFVNSIAGIGEENYNNEWLRWLSEKGVFGTTGLGNANGGIIKRKKSKKNLM